MPADVMPADKGAAAAEKATENDDIPGTEDGTIAAERAHLARSREFLHLMRENVLTLAQNPMAGDRVSLEYLKADLYRRAGLCAVEVLRPLAQGAEPIRWKSETAVAPWVIYILAAA